MEKKEILFTESLKNLIDVSNAIVIERNKHLINAGATIEHLKRLRLFEKLLEHGETKYYPAFIKFFERIEKKGRLFPMNENLAKSEDFVVIYGEGTNAEAKCRGRVELMLNKIYPEAEEISLKATLAEEVSKDDEKIKNYPLMLILHLLRIKLILLIKQDGDKIIVDSNVFNEVKYIEERLKVEKKYSSFFQIESAEPILPIFNFDGNAVKNIVKTVSAGFSESGINVPQIEDESLEKVGAILGKVFNPNVMKSIASNMEQNSSKGNTDITSIFGNVMSNLNKDGVFKEVKDFVDKEFPNQK